jgi:hypothetical protein
MEAHMGLGHAEITLKNTKDMVKTGENLLDTILLDAMGLMINPSSQELVGVHGDQMLHSLK